jgi:RNA polymerase sigma factor (sigma-70 family)
MSTTEFNTQILSYSSQLNNFAYKLTSDYDDAKDLLQETLIKAIKYKDSFTDPKNLKAWLCTIMKNIFINDYRRISRKQQVISPNVTTDSDRLHQVKTTHTIEAAINAKDIYKAIGNLADEYKVPFELYVEGYKYKEIAEHMDLPIGTVKSRIFLARQELMGKLKHMQK